MKKLSINIMRILTIILTHDKYLDMHTEYTRGNYLVLPVNDDDLETNYSEQEVIDVSTKNDVRVGQTGTSEYMVHQYKNFVGSNMWCNLEWEGQSTFAPLSSTVYLQIYNRNTSVWDTVDSDNSVNADIDFALLVNIADLTNYKNISAEYIN